MGKDYLLDRNGTFYFRMRVSEPRHILKDSNLNIAAQKSKLLGKELSALFKKAMNGMVNMELLFPTITAPATMLLTDIKFPPPKDLLSLQFRCIVNTKRKM